MLDQFFLQVVEGEGLVSTQHRGRNTTPPANKLNQNPHTILLLAAKLDSLHLSLDHLTYSIDRSFLTLKNGSTPRDRDHWCSCSPPSAYLLHTTTKKRLSRSTSRQHTATFYRTQHSKMHRMTEFYIDPNPDSDICACTDAISIFRASNTTWSWTRMLSAAETSAYICQLCQPWACCNSNVEILYSAASWNWIHSHIFDADQDEQDPNFDRSVVLVFDCELWILTCTDDVPPIVIL